MCLGLARVVFKLVKGARQCVAGLHGKTMMGKEVNCYLDPRGQFILFVNCEIFLSSS